MNRTVVSGVAVFALLIGASMVMTAPTAEAGLFGRHRANNCGGVSTCGGGKLFGGRRCGGGFLAKFKARRAADSCCADSCAPAPADCGGCAPAADCGACGGTVVGCADCGGAVMMESAGSGIELAPGEVLVPGSESEMPAPSSSDAAPPVPVPDAVSDEA